MTDQEFHGIRARSGIDALCIAAGNSKCDKELQLLLDDGVDIDGVASYSQSTALASAASAGVLRSLNLLIERGADLNRPGANDMTPLMHSCSCGKTRGSRVALRLIEAGADVSLVRKSDDMTALKFAVHDCKPEVIQALIDHGAEVDGPPGTDQTALMIAARANNVETLQVLVQNGADTSLPCKLPWAENRTARGLAEIENSRKTAKYLASCDSNQQ